MLDNNGIKRLRRNRSRNKSQGAEEWNSILPMAAAAEEATEEMMKNLGVNSRTSAELLGQMNKQQGDNINFNLNLV